MQQKLVVNQDSNTYHSDFKAYAISIVVHCQSWKSNVDFHL